jgi:hypothetical protein
MDTTIVIILMPDGRFSAAPIPEAAVTLLSQEAIFSRLIARTPPSLADAVAAMLEELASHPEARARHASG